jgi:hypothetical protein
LRFTSGKNRAEIASAGAISDIINLFKSIEVTESTELLQHCATALWNFSIDGSLKQNNKRCENEREREREKGAKRSLI